MVDVFFAGVTLDSEIYRKIKEGRADEIDPDSLTPETLSAGYARVSRDPRSVTELRQEASRDVAKAKKSNRTIIFGMGHHSVAEHVYINFDVLNISRLAIEFLEGFRIGSSYTEKSQRYIIIGEDFVLPEEIAGTGYKEEFIDLITRQFGLYREAYPKLRAHVLDKNPDPSDKLEMGRLEGLAKEDARYILSLATKAQVGTGFNCRTLEKLIREGTVHPLAEIRELSEKILGEVEDVAPSLLMLVIPEEFRRRFGDTLDNRFIENWRSDLARASSEPFRLFGDTETHLGFYRGPEVRLIDRGVDGEERVIASLLSQDRDIDDHYARLVARRLLNDEYEAVKFMKTAFKNLGEHDKLPRAFERAEMEFEVTMSSSCFAQMKRHRMMTILPKPYNPGLGLTIPESVKEIGFEERYRELLDESRVPHDLLQKRSAAAPYFLSNAHQRRVVIRVNARQLYNLSRFREDDHAQWDIRDKVKQMLDIARGVYPTIMMFSGGKSEFDDVRKGIYEE